MVKLLVYKMVSINLKHPVYHKGYEFFKNTLYISTLYSIFMFKENLDDYAK